MMNIPIVTLNTLMPLTLAASAFPPTAYIFLPNVVLFQMNHATKIAMIAGIISFGNVISSPFTTPSVHRPPSISLIFASIDPTGVPDIRQGEQLYYHDNG